LTRTKTVLLVVWLTVLHSFKAYLPCGLPKYNTRGYIVLKILLDFYYKNALLLLPVWFIGWGGGCTLNYQRRSILLRHRIYLPKFIYILLRLFYICVSMHHIRQWPWHKCFHRLCYRIWVSEWVLLSAKWAIYQLYHVEKKFWTRPTRLVGLL